MTEKERLEQEALEEELLVEEPETGAPAVMDEPEEMVAEAPLEGEMEPVEGEVPEDVPIAGEMPAEVPAGEAVGTAEGETVAVPKTALDEIRNQLATMEEEKVKLQEANKALQELIGEMSQSASTDTMDEVLMPEPIDINNLMFADPEEAKEAMAEHDGLLMKVAKAEAKKEVLAALGPMIHQMKCQEDKEAHQKLMEELAAEPSLAGFSDMAPRLEAMVQGNPIYKGANPKEAYVNAYLAAKGFDSLKAEPTAPPTVDEWMAMYESSPELQKMVEEHRINQLNSNQSQQVPTFSPSQGFGGIATEIPEKPKNFEEARRLAEKKGIKN